MRHRPLALAALAVLLAIIVSCYAAPWLAPYRPDATDLFGTLRGPSPAHLLGTDELGRDILSRLMYGGRATLTEAALVVVVTLGLGLPAGLLAGFAGGWTDRVIMYLADIGLALPVIVIILLVLAIFNGNLQVAMIGMGVLLVPPLARIIRSAALAVRAEPYVDAARVSGVRPARIILRHVLPRVRGTILTQASIVAALALLFTTGLAYLGFGPAAPNPSWGSMTAEADQVLAHSPWLLVASGGAIGLTVLCLGLVGDALRDITTGAWTGQADPAPRTSRSRGRSRPAPTPIYTVSSEEKNFPSGNGPEEGGGIPETGGRPEAGTEAGTGAEGAGGVGRLGAGGGELGALLCLRGLTVTFPRGEREVAVTQGVSLEVRAGETVGLVGESGCGKTSVARAIVGLLRGGGRVAAGQVYFGGRDVTSLAGRDARRYRGGQVALITQEPMASLDPNWRVGALVAQAVRCHKPMPRAAAAGRVRELFELVRLPDPDRVARLYPHELSGGMAQRVAIARALAGNPSLLVADEPTTALDVTLQAEILALLRTLQRETGLAVLIVSHDWQVVADSCDRVIVMYAGQVVEQATAAGILGSPRHPYTQLLLAASPSSAPDGAQSLPVIAGTIPAPEDWPAACHFGARCPHATDACHAGPVPLSPVPPVSGPAVSGPADSGPADSGPATERLARCVRAGELSGSMS